nr:immunoglobulin light chain junction region [Macaca mulatta]
DYSCQVWVIGSDRPVF